ncbi:TetR-like C-terminal domain-containing protein [Arthrobacter sp. MYb227]|uniref:TetR-like C-terminal domain-containing protein n=1 Tax=Arthrobacter sp. MYb227 TaxID=1848601 RepID=UPI0015E381BC|nr:TetR/AcrR family transcriptional regulator [Arthrobacter sp. MYb227]
MPGTDSAPPVPHTAKRGPGRPRATDIERRVLQASRELISESANAGEYTLNQLVERSGVSRAAIYRRWDSLRTLNVAALDIDRVPLPQPAADTLRETLLQGYAQGVTAIDDSAMAMITKRLIMGLRDPALQRSYWERHVRRRRQDFTELLLRAQQDGQIRKDIDVEIALDLINGLGYYQGVVRGEWGTKAAQARVAAGIELVWDAIAVK